MGFFSGILRVIFPIWLGCYYGENELPFPIKYIKNEKYVHGCLELDLGIFWQLGKELETVFTK